MRPTRLLSALALLLLAAVPGRAVSPHLVEDVEPGFHNGGSLPFVFASLRGGVTLFTASSVDSGYELWRSDGTAEGTFQLLDGCPGPCSIDDPLFVEAGDRAFFFTSDLATGGVIGGSLWVTGGSPEDTRVLASNLVVNPENPPVWVPELGLLFFTGNDGVHGNGLWRSDGTAAGTRLVRGFSPTPGIESPFPKELTSFRGRLYFVVSHRERGPALWVTDGTARGTRLVRDTWPARIDHAAPTLLRATSTRLFFFAPSPDRGIDLWRSDGSRTGTVPLTDLVPGRRDLTPFGARVIGERLYFVADAGEGQELWTSNGNARGTRRLTNLPDPNAFLIGKLQLPVPAPGGRAAFVGDDGVHGTELWLTNGAVAGTRGLDLCRGECSSAPVFFPLHGGKLYLTAEDARGRELWLTNGTAAGTRLVRDLCPGACSSHPASPRVFGPWLLFTTRRPSGDGTWLFRTDGTRQRTVRFAEADVPVVFPPSSGVSGGILFAGWDPEHGYEPWRTDGTAAGTRLVEDLQGTHAASSSPSHLAAVDGRLRFVARERDGDAARLRFWESDGSAAGTVPRGGDLSINCFNELYPLTTLSGGDPLFACPESYPIMVLWRGTEGEPVRLTSPNVWVTPSVPVAVLGSTVFFSAVEYGFGFELWKTDGTPEGTERVIDLLPGDRDASPHHLTVFQDRVWFVAWSQQTSGTGLWSTDGTEEGTRLLVPDFYLDVLTLLGVSGGRLWFSAKDDRGQGFELWSTDGTPEGTRAFDIIPGPAHFAPFRLIPAGDRMFLSGTQGGQGLWVSDGTAEGTRRLGDGSLLPRAQADLETGDATLVGDRLFFRAYENGVLWVSDGTAVGTRLAPGPAGQPLLGARDLTTFAGQLFFLWNGGIWRTDGTAAGTLQVDGDFAVPGELTVVGARLFFRATDEIHGTELWVLEP